MTVSVNPKFLPFTAWADAVILEVPYVLPRAADESRWKEWALEVTRLDAVAPDPSQFEDWRVWALAWVEGQ